MGGQWCANVATPVNLANDATIDNAGNLTLKSVGIPGTYGSSSIIPQITTDYAGRVTNVTPILIPGIVPPTLQTVLALGDFANYPIDIGKVSSATPYSSVTIGMNSDSSGIINLFDTGHTNHIKLSANISGTMQLDMSHGSVLAGMAAGTNAVFQAAGVKQELAFDTSHLMWMTPAGTDTIIANVLSSNHSIAWPDQGGTVLLTSDTVGAGSNVSAQLVTVSYANAHYPGAAGFVPYTGATADLNLGPHTLTDAVGVLSVAPNARKLFNAAGNTVMSWGPPALSISATTSVTIGAPAGFSVNTTAALFNTLATGVTTMVTADPLGTLGTAPLPVTSINSPDNSIQVSPPTGIVAVQLNTSHNNTFTAGQRGAVVTLADAHTISPDFNTGNNFQVQLGGVRMLGNPMNVVAGQTGYIDVWQDATGAESFGTYDWMYEWTSGTAGTYSNSPFLKDKLVYNVDNYATSSVTMSIANPCVVTWSTHGLLSGMRVQFTTTGSLPAGGVNNVLPGTTYWINVTGPNTFNIATSLANLQASNYVNTSGGTQFGTHTGTSGAIMLNLVNNVQ